MKLVDVEEVHEIFNWSHQKPPYSKKTIHRYIDMAREVDAVQVVRCKDCKWYDMTDSSGTVEPIGYRCKKVNRLWREPDDFCKGAERKEECGHQ